MDFLWLHYNLGYLHAYCSRHPRRIYNGMAGWAFVAGFRGSQRRWHRG